jgi:carbon monoxide dehydrogenase subunit G
MKRVLRGAIGLVIALAVIVVGGAYVLPGEAVVERHIVVKAPPEAVYAVIGDLKRFNEWSPWADIDPATKYTFEGSPLGAGQIMRWTSNDPDVGSGSQTIVAAVANVSTETELELGDMGKAKALMALAAVDGGTGVTWSFRMPLSGVVARWMGPMFDSWVGADYEKGLARLKGVVEKEAAGG